MTPTMDHFLQRAGAELASAARNHARRRRHRRQLALRGTLVASVAVVVSVVVLATQQQAQAGAVQTKVNGNLVEIQVVDPAASPSVIQQALSEAKIAVQIDNVATGPSKAGKLVGLAGLGSTGPRPLSFRLQIGSRLTLVVGRTAGPGEPYGAATNPFARGEPLACLGGKGSDAAALASHVPRGINVVWRDAATATPVPLGELPGHRVDTAVATSSTDVVIIVGTGTAMDRTNWCP